MTIICLYLYIPNLNPSVETQIMFNEAAQTKSKISFDEWYTERRLRSDLLVQNDIGSGQHVNSLNYMISEHQTSLGTTSLDKIII